MLARTFVPTLSLGLLVSALAGCNAGVRYDDAMVAPQSTLSATPDATAAATPTPIPTPTPTPSAAPAKEGQKLSVVARWVDVNGKESVVFTPDSGVQKPSYTHYRFKYADYVAAVGEANLTKDVELEVDCTPGAEKSAGPSDPKAPAPIGGIKNTYYDCTILKATPTK